MFATPHGLAGATLPLSDLHSMCLSPEGCWENPLLTPGLHSQSCDKEWLEIA